VRHNNALPQTRHGQNGVSQLNAMPKHPRMQIAWQRTLRASSANQAYRLQQTPRVIPMPVRQHNCVHATEIDVQPVSISLDSVVFGARIKQDRLRVLLSPCRDHKRQPMVRTADRLPREHLQPMDYVAPHFRMNVCRGDL
jgi:hypothetical protein